jgi:hypothetical protein
VRSRFQSVAGLVFDVPPEISSFMRFGPPGRNEVAFVFAPIGADHRDFDAIDEPNGVNASLAVLEAVVVPFNGWAVENPTCVVKADAVPLHVACVLPRVPSEVHIYVLY